MKFSNFLPSTRLSQLQLLDIALALAFIPLVFLLKLPMLIYLLLALVFIYKQKSSQAVVYSFMVLGLFAIALSFFAEYNFSSFSRLLVFISLLISVLSYAVVLQRLTREINIYLLLSPSMLMILSFFFYNSIEMLFYALFTLFAFTFLLLYHKMQSTFKNTLRINSLLYLFSLPIVALLFLVFPRISYKDASYGFKGEAAKRTGHDGTMYTDSQSLLVPSSKLVMEVSFKKSVPAQSLLYFRGSTLYVDKGNQWITASREVTDYPRLLKASNLVEYNIKLYPHQQRWLYMLDLPLSVAKDASIDKDYISLSKRKLFETYQYNGRSALQYSSAKEPLKNLEKALKVDTKRDPKTYTELLKAIDRNEKDEIKAKKLLNFFQQKNLAYSLKPEPIDLEHPLDSFLLDSKIGYCVHFASAFATSARLLGIPSRIITGYKADRSNAINNYLLVRESDAHAWVELYLKDRGWVRFEPTATASRVIAPQDRGLANSYTQAYLKTSATAEVLKQININYLYTRYLINTWILQYDRNKQMNILKKLLSDSLFLFKFLMAILALVLLSIVLFMFFQKRSCDDKYLCEMQTLMKVLKKEGFIKKPTQTMSDFLSSIEKSAQIYNDLKEINDLYHKGRYSRTDVDTLATLKAKIVDFKKGL